MKYDIEVGFGTYLNQFFLNKKKKGSIFEFGFQKILNLVIV